MGETKQNIWQSRWYPGRAIWKWLRPLFTLRMLFRCLFAFACLATFVALFYAEENWRGKRAWEQFKREWEAKGERFDLAAFISKPVPAEQNFADSRFFRPLFDYEYQMREGQQSV